MKNINQDSQSSSEVLSTYQIVNNIPEKQAIVLQNTNKDYPIQLRVDPVTDYHALWITVFASVLVSIITATLTILLVRNSNKILLEGQLAQQKTLLADQTLQLGQQLNHQLDLQKNELNNTNTKDIIKEYKELFLAITTSHDNVAIFTSQFFRIRLANKLDDENPNYSQDKIEEFGIKTTALIDKIRFSTDNLKILLDSNSIVSEDLQKYLNDAIKYMSSFYKAVDRNFCNNLINNYEQLDISALRRDYADLSQLINATKNIKIEGVVVLRSLVEKITY